LNNIKSTAAGPRKSEHAIESRLFRGPEDLRPEDLRPPVLNFIQYWRPEVFDGVKVFGEAEVYGDGGLRP
jgi:hypothetical protein